MQRCNGTFSSKLQNSGVPDSKRESSIFYRHRCYYLAGVLWMCSAGTVLLRLAGGAEGALEEGTTRGPLPSSPSTILLTSGYNVGAGNGGLGDGCRGAVSGLGDSLHNIKSRWKKVLLAAAAAAASSRCGAVGLCVCAAAVGLGRGRSEEEGLGELWGGGQKSSPSLVSCSLCS